MGHSPVSIKIQFEGQVPWQQQQHSPSLVCSSMGLFSGQGRDVVKSQFSGHSPEGSGSEGQQQKPPAIDVFVP